ncbi:hypothetical protein FH972_023896 [Carpinus fangiana]|uniref:DNA-directed RNA polymerase II subunit RPB9-like zinc ribbon domain-containing protein n=1 Tax=Carpinus fangiana TaxID=176857 RepID=A0A5N6KXA1_9ROSI|nr:hypothetical protein FH972_023896 [Carpinus fangiana]
MGWRISTVVPTHVSRQLGGVGTRRRLPTRFGSRGIKVIGKILGVRMANLPAVRKTSIFGALVGNRLPISNSTEIMSTQTDESKKIRFRFCRECSNMLYPKEDRVNNALIFACRNCDYREPAPSSCIYRNELTNTVGETAGITQDVGQDPTVGDPTSAQQTQESGEDDDSDMPCCTMCGQEIVCDVCEEPAAELGLCLEVEDFDPTAAQVQEQAYEQSQASGGGSAFVPT